MQTLCGSFLCLAAGALLLASCTDRPLADSQGATLDASTSTGAEPPDGTTTTTTTTTTTSGPTSEPPPATGPTTDPLPPVTTGDSSTAPDEPDTGCGFLCAPDGGVIQIECDPWVQDCPQGDKCAAWTIDGGLPWDATKCVPVAANPDPPGATCTVEGSALSGLDSCDVGVKCFFVDEATLEGECVAHCGGMFNDPKCPQGQLCTTVSEGVLDLCLPPCDPLQQDCPDGRTCTFTAGSQGFTCLDVPTGAGGPLAPCEVQADCAAGLFCGDGDTISAQCDGSCCTPVCDLGAPSCPDPDQVCAPWFPGQAPQGQEHVGFCALPD